MWGLLWPKDWGQKEKKVKMKLLTAMSVALAWAIVPVSWQKRAISCSSQANLLSHGEEKLGEKTLSYTQYPV